MMKKINEEISRIAELMSINNSVKNKKLNEAISSSSPPWLRFLENIFKSSVRDSEGQIMTLSKNKRAFEEALTFDSEMAAAVRNLGVDNGDELVQAFARGRVDSATAKLILRAMINASDDVAESFYKALKSTPSYKQPIKDILADLTMLQSKNKFKTVDKFNTYVNDYINGMGWDETVVEIVKKQIKQENEYTEVLSALRKPKVGGGTGTEIIKAIGPTIIKWTVGPIAILTGLGIIYWYFFGRSLRGDVKSITDGLQKHNGYKDLDLVKKIVLGQLDGDFAKYYQHYVDFVSDDYVSALVDRLKSFKKNETVEMSEDEAKRTLDGFTLRFWIKEVKDRGLKFDSDQVIEAMDDYRISEEVPFYISYIVNEVDVSPETFKKMELQRELLMRKYTCMKEKEKPNGDWQSHIPSENVVNLIDARVLNYVMNIYQKNIMSKIVDRGTEKMAEQTNVYTDKSLTNEEELLNSIADLIKTDDSFDTANYMYTWCFLLEKNESVNKKGLIQLLINREKKKISEQIVTNPGGGNSGGRAPVPVAYDTVKCPPQNELVQFQKWLDSSKKPWYNGGQFNGQYGTCGNATKSAWANTTWKDEYQKSKAAGGGTPAPPAETLESLSSDPQLKGIIYYAYRLNFYDTNRRLIKSYSYTNDTTNFDSNPDVIGTVKAAKGLKMNRGYSDLIAYIRAVFNKWGGNIAYIELDDDKTKRELESLKGTKIFGESYIRKSKGLINLLFEQSVFFTISQSDNEKYIGGQKKYEDLGNVNADTYINYRVYNHRFNPIRPDGPNKRFPDKGPIIADIRKEIGATIPQNVDPQVFDETLYNAIKKYRTDNGITYPNDSGYIDVDLIDYIYRDKIKQGKEKLPKSQQLQSPAAKQSTNEKKLPQSFGRVKEYARVIVASGDKGEKPNFDYCKFLLSEYPKLVKQTLTLYKANPELEIKTETDEIKNIKKGIKYCGTLRSGRTKISGLSNLFTSGVKDIENLTEPFGMKETEIYSLENKQKSDINGVDATPNNTIPKPGEVKTGIA